MVFPGTDIVNAYDEKTLAAIGNFGQPFGGSTLITTQSVSGSFEVYQGGPISAGFGSADKRGRKVHPFIFTSYPTISPSFNPPIFGAVFAYYMEAFPGGATAAKDLANTYNFNTSTAIPSSNSCNYFFKL